MTQGRAAWRIINSPPADGGTNMAIDEAILEAVREGQSPPTLRLYTWQPACLSIGRFQRAARSVNFDALTALGYDFVRRPTGGRAVLHDDELTYAVIASTDELANVSAGAGASVLATYLTLSRGLAAGLARIGIPVELAPRDAGRIRRGAHREGEGDHEREGGHDRNGSGNSSGDSNGDNNSGHSAACFDSPSAYELLAQGRKIVGSAQVRRGSTFLQHGSVLISSDFAAAEAVMGLPPGSGLELSTRVATVGEFIQGFPATISSQALLSRLADALTAGFTSEVMRCAQPGQLTQAEVDLASELTAKYQSEEWNLSR